MNFATRFFLLGLLGAAALCEASPVVNIIKKDGRYHLLKDGEPFFVNGVGGSTNQELLVASGGNTLRTWSVEQTLGMIDEAHANGLMVMGGLWIEHERHGFDYNDEAAVAHQIEEMKARVDQVKNHPGLLLWGVGNEVELGYTNPKVWDTVEAVAAYIKSVDPHRPVMCVIAYPDREKIAYIKERCPSLDLLGVNAYGGIHALSGFLREYGWDKPYLVTEWGPTGFWEGGMTHWGAEMEASSTQKAAAIKQRYRYITDDPHCLGSFVFLWGQKQERTPTWFGMFLEDGSATETIDVMQEAWTGTLPVDLAPRISPLFLNGFQQQDYEKQLVLEPGQKVLAHYTLYRGDREAVDVRWEMMPESTDKRWGGDKEARPPTLAFNYVTRDVESIQFEAPAEPGPYRLFVYVKGSGNKSATANIPFLVSPSRYSQKASDLIEGQVMAVAYSGFRKGQHPDRGDGANNPTREQILEDLNIMVEHGFHLIRMYDSRENTRATLELIQEYDIPMKVLLGIWLDAEIDSYATCDWLTEPYAPELLAANKVKNQAEVNRGIELAKAFPHIVAAVNVGNEALVDWNDHLVTMDSMIAYVRQVKSVIHQPITVAENYLIWVEEGSRLAAELDFVGVHTYPIWVGKTIDEALAYTLENIADVHAALPDSRIAILEAGWATTANEFPGQANEAYQIQYYQELRQWAETTNTTVFFFEAFDEPWKGNPDNPMGAEKHWGLFFEDRSPKALAETQVALK